MLRRPAEPRQRSRQCSSSDKPPHRRKRNDCESRSASLLVCWCAVFVVTPSRPMVRLVATASRTLSRLSDHGVCGRRGCRCHGGVLAEAAAKQAEEQRAIEESQRAFEEAKRKMEEEAASQVPSTPPFSITRPGRLQWCCAAVEAVAAIVACGVVCNHCAVVACACLSQRRKKQFEEAQRRHLEEKARAEEAKRKRLQEEEQRKREAAQRAEEQRRQEEESARRMEATRQREAQLRAEEARLREEARAREAALALEVRWQRRIPVDVLLCPPCRRVLHVDVVVDVDVDVDVDAFVRVCS